MHALPNVQLENKDRRPAWVIDAFQDSTGRHCTSAKYSFAVRELRLGL